MWWVETYTCGDVYRMKSVNPGGRGGEVGKEWEVGIERRGERGGVARE